MSTVQSKLLLNAVCKNVDNVCTFILRDQIVIGGPNGEETRCPTIFISAMNFKVLDQFLLGNVMKLNFLLYLAWPILKD